MSALRKKIAEKKAAEIQQKPPVVPPPSNPVPASAAVAGVASAPPSTAPADAATPGGISLGWLSKGSLYPEGSDEAAPKMWRGINTARPNVFQLLTHDDYYEVQGDFGAASNYIGREDFAVTRNGLQLHIKGNPNDDPQSLVAGLEETVTLPIDAAFEGMSAEYTKQFTLVIRIPRAREMQQLLAQLSVEEKDAILAHLAHPVAPVCPPAAPQGSDGSRGSSMDDVQVGSQAMGVVGTSGPESPERTPSLAPSNDSTESADGRH